MGMKEYKFLIHSRDLIVKSERKIFSIDNRMSEIEQEVVELKSKRIGNVHLLSQTRKVGIYEYKLPDIGEDVVEGEVVKWMVSVGDSIMEDDPMLLVMTDKATVEIPSQN